MKILIMPIKKKFLVVPKIYNVFFFLNLSYTLTKRFELGLRDVLT